MKTIDVTESMGWGNGYGCTAVTVPGANVILHGAAPGHQSICDSHADCNLDRLHNFSDTMLALACARRGHFLRRFAVGQQVRYSEFDSPGTIVSIRERLIVVRRNSVPRWVPHGAHLPWSGSPALRSDGRAIRSASLVKLVRLRLPKFALLNWNFEQEAEPIGRSSILPASFREFVIGFGPTVVPANSTSVFQAQPQVAFRGTRLVVPADLAEHFTINDIRVGRDSQAISSAPIPATAFSERAVGVNLGLDTATPGIIITLSVSNITNTPQTFSAVLTGTTLSYPDHLEQVGGFNLSPHYPRARRGMYASPYASQGIQNDDWIVEQRRLAIEEARTERAERREDRDGNEPFPLADYPVFEDVDS
jgi:hypothetical protein